MTTEQLLGLGLQGSIMLTVLGFGLASTLADASYLFRRPALLLRCVLSMSVVMPVVAAAVASALDLPFEVKAALVAISVAPVPPLLQKNQIGAGGRVSFVAGLLVAMSALAIFTVPLWVWILDRMFDRHGVVGPIAVAKIMLTSVFLPLAVGLLVRHFFPASERASSKVMAIAGALLAVCAVVVVWGLWPQIRMFIGNGAVLVMAGLAVIGLAVGHLLGGPIEGDRTALAMATASRHPAVALAVATSGTLTSAKPEIAIILMYLVVALLVSLPYQRWRRHRDGTAT
jgi:BASS family bile acid:Na+ symporter